jgi:hypothetical protein
MAEVIAVSSSGKCCSVCNMFKPFTEFNSKKCSKYGYHIQCKECRRFIELRSIHREENRQPMIIVDGEPTMCEELSLPELKALQKQHNIILDRHYNKKELVELSQQRGVLPANYTIGRRQVKNQKVTAEPKTHLTSRASAEPNSSLASSLPTGVTNQKYIPKANIRGHARRVELKLINDETFQPTEVQVFPSLYKAGNFLGTFNSVVEHFNRRRYKSKINGKMYSRVSQKK